MIYSTLQSIGSRGKQPKDLRVNKSRDFLPGAKATILCCKPKIILNNWKKIRKQKSCENKSIKEKTIWTNTYYNGRFQKWSSYSILTIFLVGILQNKWKFFGGSAMKWRGEDVLQKEDGFSADRCSSWRRQQKIRQIRQDFNNEEILTENVEEHLKSCQILERVMIFWVRKLTVNK